MNDLALITPPPQQCKISWLGAHPEISELAATRPRWGSEASAVLFPLRFAACHYCAMVFPWPAEPEHGHATPGVRQHLRTQEGPRKYCCVDHSQKGPMSVPEVKRPDLGLIAVGLVVIALGLLGLWLYRTDTVVPRSNVDTELIGGSPATVEAFSVPDEKPKRSKKTR